MPMHIRFELSDSDLEYFCEIMLRARGRTPVSGRDRIVGRARRLLQEVERSDATDFIRDSIRQLETLIDMVTDEDWGLDEEDLKRVLVAISYFSEPEDLIADDVPGLGYLDDAIMIAIVCRELEHEIQAYSDFRDYKNSGDEKDAGPASAVEKSEWLEERRRQLHARMRRRREGEAGSRKTKSPFSLF